MEITTEARKVINEEISKNTTFNLTKVSVRKFQISNEIIVRLKLYSHNTRDVRRNIARKNGISWEKYKIIEEEYTRRLNQKLDVNTGKPLF